MRLVRSSEMVAINTKSRWNAKQALAAVGFI
jgi:hypothetical protein